MSLPEKFKGRLVLPIVGAPMFLVSSPELVIAQCRAGIIGTMPTLNFRESEALEAGIEDIKAKLSESGDEPIFGLNIVVRKSNDRVAEDVDICVRQKVPLVITSLGVPDEIVRRIHSYGGLVFHDVTTIRHARKAIGVGVDGVIAVANGAGGHGGILGAIAFVRELRTFYDGTILLGGGISDGHGVLAAQAMGADLAYVGTRFIATKEGNTVDEYKKMIVDSVAADIVYTPYFTGVPGNYLAPSIDKAGLDSRNLPAERREIVFQEGTTKAKAWRDIWGAGQGVGAIEDVPDVATLIDRFRQEYTAGLSNLNGSRDQDVSAVG